VAKAYQVNYSTKIANKKGELLNHLILIFAEVRHASWGFCLVKIGVFFVCFFQENRVSSTAEQACYIQPSVPLIRNPI
jgi:hypothetical protein